MRHHHLITTTAKPGQCWRCRRPVLTAHDEGEPVRTDPTPLPDRAAEIVALLAGRRTYTRLHIGWLVYRTPDRIQYDIGPVFAEHRCPTSNQHQQLTIDMGVS